MGYGVLKMTAWLWGVFLIFTTISKNAYFWLWRPRKGPKSAIIDKKIFHSAWDMGSSKWRHGHGEYFWISGPHAKWNGRVSDMTCLRQRIDQVSFEDWDLAKATDGPHREAIRVDTELIIVNDEHDNFKRMKECESTDSIVNDILKYHLFKKSW